MIEQILKWDEELFLWLNSIHTPWMDPVMFQISGTITWIPLYAIILYFIYKQDPKNSWWVFGGIALTVLIADQATSGLMKPYFERLRPCHDERWADQIHNYQRCGGLFGFASSHAANTFGFAVFMNLKMRGKMRFLPWLFFWAAVVSYSRIYLGVHYPLDILVGALVGAMAGTVTWLCIVYIKWEILKKLLK